ncbi:MAG: porin family protein [Dysgonomonas sp.]
MYTFGQIQKPKNQPYADQKMYHLGFLVGIHTQDMTLLHTGYTAANGEAWFAEIPSYSVGFNVGIIGDRYLNEYFNLRISPTLYFGEKGFVFKEQLTGEEYKTTFKTSYLSLPLHLKFSASRMNNYRPYFLAGGYANMDLSPKKDMALRFKKVDYGLEFGVGCNIYLPLFKLCPELKFSLGLVDMIDKDNSDVTDNDLLKYRNAISSGKTRMISLIFNFE